MSNVIDAAQAPGVFDVLSFIEGTAYPTQQVTVFTDAKSATELLERNKERLDAEVKGESVTGLDDRIDYLIEQVQASTIVFDLRGMPPGIVEEIYPADDEADKKILMGRENKLIAHTIVRAMNFEGVVDARVWDEAAVAALRKFLKEGEFAKLSQGVAAVNFNAVVFDQATDAGFLSRGSDLAS